MMRVLRRLVRGVIVGMVLSPTSCSAMLFGWPSTCQFHSPYSLDADCINGGCMDGQCLDAGSSGARWYTQVEALVMSRDGPQDIAMTGFDTTGLGDVAILQGTGGLDFDYETGVRVTLGIPCGQSHYVELTWSGVLDFDSTSEVVDPGAGLLSPFSQFDPGAFGITSGFDNASSHRLAYSSEVQNLEVNLRGHALAGGRASVDWVAGLCYFRDSEDFLFESVEPGGGLLGSDAFGFYGVQSHNDLLGFKVGGDAAFWLNDRIALGAKARAGLGLNIGSYDAFFLQDVGVINRNDFGADSTSLSPLIELGVHGVVRVTPHLSLRAGYEAMLVGGLVLAPEQFDVYAGFLGARINDSGMIVLQGATAGVDLVW